MSAYKKIHELSGNACHSGLNVFGVPPTNVAINKSTIRELLPVNSNQESPHEFRYFLDNQWVDLSKTFLYLQVGIEKQSGTSYVPIDAMDTNIALVQSFATSFVRQLKIYINSVEVYDSTTLNPYLCYIKMS